MCLTRSAWIALMCPGSGGQFGRVATGQRVEAEATMQAEALGRHVTAFGGSGCSIVLLLGVLTAGVAVFRFSGLLAATPQHSGFRP